MRITFVISALTCGGAERVATLMANHWASRGHAITILTFDDGSTAPCYPLRPDVRLNPLGLSAESATPLAGLRNNLGRLRILRRELHQTRPQMTIGFMDRTNVLVLLATRGLGIPVAITEHTVPWIYDIGPLWNALRRLCYPLAQALVVQTPEVRDFFSRRVRAKTRIIPNPVVVDSADEGPPPSEKPRPTLISMGRLSEEKGCDLIIRAFGRIAAAHSEWRLVLLGEGGQRAELESLRDSLGLRGRVFLPGHAANPFPQLRVADIFVLASRFEGFANALAEAMACGLPAVATDCPVGPRHIIRDGVDGLLVPCGDEEALAKALARLISDQGLRRSFAARAPEVLDRFGVEKVMGMWEEVLTEMTARKNLP